jgi:hypothetical protein
LHYILSLINIQAKWPPEDGEGAKEIKNIKTREEA